MLVDFQKCACSLGRNFVGNCIVALQRRTIHCFSWFKLTNEIHEHSSPINHDDSTVVL